MWEVRIAKDFILVLLPSWKVADSPETTCEEKLKLKSWHQKGEIFEHFLVENAFARVVRVCVRVCMQ